jgi:regulatory protein
MESKQFKQFLSKAMYWCSKSEKAPGDILQKLQEWDVPQAYHDSIIIKLKKENFINEDRFALAFTNDKFRFNKWGKGKIKYALQTKQVNEDAIWNALNQIDSNEYREAAKELINSKIRQTREPNMFKLKQKVYRFMASRGFETGMVFDLWEEIAR